ncbi:stalk domain-containing protein [Anaerotignum faecicola]|nr:stalk domain-containing protein [Anaerotignum faecicola]
MNWKKWISIAAAVCLAVTAVPMRAVAQEELVQEKMLEEIKEEIKEELKEEPKEEKEEKEEKEKLQEKSDEKTEPQEESKKELPKGISLLMEGENSTAVSENEAADFEGEGEENDPYLIEDVEDLKKLAENVKNGTDYEGKYFQLTVNIDLKNEEWTPIGTIVYTGEFGRSEERYFKGTFDGDGHQIANLTITGRNEYVGLFGYVRNATIQNCNVAGEVSGYNAVGGIVGAVDGKTNNILNCSFQGNVTGNVYVGGIVGQVQNQCEVSSCYAIGTVHGGNDKVGGIAGEGRGAIKNCYALADVSAGGKFVGGIAGDASSVTIENCYYSGEVSARGSAGGIVGNVWRGTIQNCVSLAESVTGSNTNRIVGNIYNLTLTNNYAWSDPALSADDDAGLNGANFTYTNGTLSKQFSEIFKNDSAWKFTDNGLPILKNTGGTQSAYLPPYLTGEGFYGKGTAENPYEIRNVNDLKLLAQKVNSNETANSGITYEGKYFKQTANIDLEDLENEPNWTPIGKENNHFKGIFDGGGHKITSLSITSSNGKIGLFGFVSNATIRNCNVAGEIEGNNFVGGIVGNAVNNTHILNCSFQGDVKGELDYVGGIAGNTTADCEVSGCFVTGKVKGSQRVGGIAGQGIGIIRNCYALADVTARTAIAGGIAGRAYNLTIENCYYGGKVSAGSFADNSAGGIAGETYGSPDSSTKIKNCVSLAESVTCDFQVNRIAGDERENTSLTNNHSYNRTKLVIDGEITYPTGGAENNVNGADVYISNGRVMTDVPNQILFDWDANDFTEENGWSIPTEAGKLPSLREGEYPNLPDLPSKDLTIDQAPQHFTTKNIGNGFVVKVTSEGTLNESIEFTKEYRLHDNDTTDAWTAAVPNTAGTYDVKITRAADGDINPFACEIPAGLVLTKKRSSSSGAATQTYTAQFDTNGGSAVDKVKTDKNGKIERPADPTKEGYIFVGWYSDSKLTKPFDFSAELTANSTLYAKWKENNEIILTIGSRKISVFGREIKNDVAPKIVNDRTMLPIRIVAESLGGTVTWNGELQRVTIQKGADVILITIGADTAYVNGTAVKLDAAAFVENGRTYLPLRFISETLGAQVVWNEAEKTVTITK